jgi:hypothetical protein
VNKMAKPGQLVCIAIYTAIVLGIWPQAMAVASPSDDHVSHGMVLDLGKLSDNVKVTAQYSNAVLVAVLPYFSNVSKELDLPTPHPITQADIAQFHVLPFREMTASARLKNGCVFNFAFGFVVTYVSPRSPLSSHVQRDTPTSNSQKLMTEQEVVQEARNSILRLGISLSDVFADGEPTVTTYRKPFPNSVARYRIQWLEPHGETATDFIINPVTREVERFNFGPLTNLRRSPPDLGILPPNDDSHDMFSSQIPPQEINPEYARQLVPMMFKAVDDYAKKLNLPITLPLTTNDVARIKIHNNGGWPHSEIWLTNGWKFIYRHTMVNGYYSPNIFNSTDFHPFHLQNFEGKWNLNEEQAINLVKRQLAKLDYSTNNIHMDFPPNVIFPAGYFKKIIPRYFFEWDYLDAARDLQSKVEAEVNADNGTVESLYYDDKVYWSNRPPIDVPISVQK